MTTNFQQINLGNYPNDGTGDDLRTAFQKVNANFGIISTEDLGITGIVNLGSGAQVYKDKNNTTLEFRSLVSTDNSVTFTTTANTLDLNVKIAEFINAQHVGNRDLLTVGADINLGPHAIEGGDIQTTVFGVDMKLVNSLLAMALKSNTLSADYGSFTNPTGSYTLRNSEVKNPKGYETDFGTFVLYKPGNDYDFGSFA